MEAFLKLLGGNASGGALVTLVAFAVMAVWRGWLVPRSTVERLEAAQRAIVEIQEKRLTEAVSREAEWRQAYDTAREANTVLTGHVDDVLAGLSTVEQLVRELASVRARGGGNR